MMKRWTEKDYLDNIRAILKLFDVSEKNIEYLMSYVEGYGAFMQDDMPDCDNCGKKRNEDGPMYNEGHE